MGDLLKPQFLSNHQGKKSNHIYFTATLDAELVMSGLKEIIYLVEPLENLKMIQTLRIKDSQENLLVLTALKKLRDEGKGIIYD